MINLFLKMARKAEEADNFVFVQLIEQELGIYHKLHSDYARQDQIDLAWERISHETKDSGFRLSSFETTLAPLFKLSQKNGCYITYFTNIFVLNATYYIVTLLPHYMARLYTVIIRCRLSC
jgi:hypothetical protein